MGQLSPLRYRGYVYDRETGLYYLQSRYYNPTWGRFLNADALVSTGQGVLGYNMFAYCGNNPVIRKDESGDWWQIVVGIVAIAATINDIYQLVRNDDGKVAVEKTTSIDAGAEKDNVKIKDSYKILTPWVQYGYSVYLNHFNSDTKDIIDGTSVGVTYEWGLHNVAYAACSILGIEQYKVPTQSVDVGKTLFSDDHAEPWIEHGMKIPYTLFDPLNALIDLIINGGYR